MKSREKTSAAVFVAGIVMGIIAVLIIGIAIGYYLNSLWANDNTVRPDSNTERNEYVVWHDAIDLGGHKPEYPQIFGLEDKEIEKTANENLSRVFLSGIIDYSFWNDRSPEVLYQTGEYLCVESSYWYVNPNSGGGKEGVCSIIQTISIENGELVFLNDILEVDDRFIEYLYESPTAIKACKTRLRTTEPWSEADDKRVNEYIRNEYSFDEFRELLLSACADYTADNYYGKCSFYFTPYSINIVRDWDYVLSKPFNIRLDLYDIEEFLKVEKW